MTKEEIEIMRERLHLLVDGACDQMDRWGVYISMGMTFRQGDCLVGVRLSAGAEAVEVPDQTKADDDA